MQVNQAGTTTQVRIRVLGPCLVLRGPTQTWAQIRLNNCQFLTLNSWVEFCLHLRGRAKVAMLTHRAALNSVSKAAQALGCRTKGLNQEMETRITRSQSGNHSVVVKWAII